MKTKIQKWRENAKVLPLLTNFANARKMLSAFFPLLFFLVFSWNHTEFSGKFSGSIIYACTPNSQMREAREQWHKCHITLADALCLCVFVYISHNAFRYGRHRYLVTMRDRTLFCVCDVRPVPSSAAFFKSRWERAKKSATQQNSVNGIFVRTRGACLCVWARWLIAYLRGWHALLTMQSSIQPNAIIITVYIVVVFVFTLYVWFARFPPSFYFIFINRLLSFGFVGVLLLLLSFFCSFDSLCVSYVVMTYALLEFNILYLFNEQIGW